MKNSLIIGLTSLFCYHSYQQATLIEQNIAASKNSPQKKQQTNSTYQINADLAILKKTIPTLVTGQEIIPTLLTLSKVAIWISEHLNHNDFENESWQNPLLFWQKTNKNSLEIIENYIPDNTPIDCILYSSAIMQTLIDMHLQIKNLLGKTNDQQELTQNIHNALHDMGSFLQYLGYIKKTSVSGYDNKPHDLCKEFTEITTTLSSYTTFLEEIVTLIAPKHPESNLDEKKKFRHLAQQDPEPVLLTNAQQREICFSYKSNYNKKRALQIADSIYWLAITTPSEHNSPLDKELQHKPIDTIRLSVKSRYGFYGELEN